MNTGSIRAAPSDYNPDHIIINLYSLLDDHADSDNSKYSKNNHRSALTYDAAALRKLVLLPYHISPPYGVLPPSSRTGTQLEASLNSQLFITAQQVLELVSG